MDLRQLLRLSVEAAWRRRFLIILPVVALLPLGLAFAKYGPKSYVAKSLMLLQESTRDPLSRDLPSAARMQDRIAGLQALLKSDRVLYAAIGDMNGGAAPADPKTLASMARGLASALSLELLGNDFLEFRLKGAYREGLGRDLEFITVRFLEALLPAQDVVSATELLLERRREEMGEAERRLTRFRQHMNERLPTNFAADQSTLKSETTVLGQKKAELAAVTAEIATLRTRIAAGSSLFSELQPGHLPSPRSVTDAGKPVPDAIALEANEQRAVTLGRETENVSRQVEALKQRLDQAYAPVGTQLAALEAEARKAREAYDALAKRSAAAPKVRSAGLLNAPERIKVIDPARDPETPRFPASLIVLVAFLASIALAFAIALAAELLDQRLRHRAQFEKITGVPVLARLP